MSTAVMYRRQEMTLRGMYKVYQQLTLLQKVLIALAIIGVVVSLFVSQAYAADADVFSAAATQFQGWVGGSLGKLAAFAALGVGAVVAAIRKDWSWFFGAVILSVGVGVITTIINASFTAVL